jgi:hypothetical protein
MASTTAAVGAQMTRCGVCWFRWSVSAQRVSKAAVLGKGTRPLHWRGNDSACGIVPARNLGWIGRRHSAWRTGSVARPPTAQGSPPPGRQGVARETYRPTTNVGARSRASGR